MKLEREIMEIEKAIMFIENSFLFSLLIDSQITDISFNGEKIFYMHNEYGRKESDIIINQSEAKDFIRQIANLTEQQFSYQTPILDVSIGKYRINAVHQSIGRVFNRPSLTFCIRVSSTSPRIHEKSEFLTPPLEKLVSHFLSSHLSIVIGGVTGVGKTEFQKYLLRKFPLNERIIIIDNVLELDQIRNDSNLDFTSWQVDERNPYSSVQSLVRNALRNNPDWLIVAEARGKEMNDVLSSSMTGHPIITTIHANSLESMPHRIARMVMMDDKKSNFEDIIADVTSHIKIYFYLSKRIEEGRVVRYISKVGEVDKNGNMNVIFENKIHSIHYNKLSDELLRQLEIKNDDKELLKMFVGEFHE